MERHLRILQAASLVAICTSLTSAQVAAPDPLDTNIPPAAAADIPNGPEKPPAPREIDGEPVYRGPVHEAFAEPLALMPEPGQIVPRKPPASIEEIAPQTSDDDPNLDWIPGYWAWDEQQQDFVWVSGVWRRVPKGRRWQIGYWREADGGYRWVPGAWLKLGSGSANDFAQEEVLPIPPESLEEGPTGPAPTQNHFWVPGVWQRHDNRYAWRPGFWTAAHENWVWVPDHYTWTPAGCMFVPGYWDYPWERRGMLYAPCRFAAADLIGNVYFRPALIINTNRWLNSLWVRPGSSHYFYGDYYDYGHLGYTPWYSYYHQHPNFCDPLYTHYRWVFTLGFGNSLHSHLHGLHGSYSQHAHLRPTVTHYRHQDRGHHERRDYATAFGRHGDRPYRSDRDRRDNREGDRRVTRARDLVEQRRQNRNNEDQTSPRDGLADNPRSNDRLGTSSETNNRLNTPSRFGNRLNTRSENGNRLATGSGLNRRPGNHEPGTATQASGPDSNVDSTTRARTARETINRFRGAPDRETRNDRSLGNSVVLREQPGPSPSGPTVNRSTSNAQRSMRDSQSSSRGTSQETINRLRGTLDRKTRNDRFLGNAVVPREQPGPSPSGSTVNRSTSNALRSTRDSLPSSRQTNRFGDSGQPTFVRPNPSRAVDPRPSMARSAARSATTPSRARPDFSRPTPRPSPATSGPRRSVSSPRPSPTASGPRRSVSSPRPSPTASGPRPSIARSTARSVARPSRATITRPTPSASGRSSGGSSFGFSTSGMRKARGADLNRQRAAMNKRMSERKGRD